MFVTLFYGMLQEKDRLFTYVNAGHNPPVLFRGHNSTVEKLMPTGIVLGALENQEYKSRSVPIENGDVLVMYTDGVTEAINCREELFGEKRLIEIIHNNAHFPAQVILEQILSGVKEFAGDMTQFDDITLLVIKGSDAR
jgi:sigma-B regulation protein RsbU (phosphoserine phosphatase)